MNQVELVIEEQQVFIGGVQKVSNFVALVVCGLDEAILWRFFPADPGKAFTPEDQEKSLEHVTTFVEPVRLVLGVEVTHRKAKLLHQPAHRASQLS